MPVSLRLLLPLVAVIVVAVESVYQCTETKECQQSLREGSECVEGFCTNPFRQGCLRRMGISVDWDEGESRLVASSSDVQDLPKRACNLDDDDLAKDCEWNVEFDYSQIRIHNGDWESSIFLSWIFQILLMEVLRVPATVGLTTERTAASSFYARDNTLEYSSAAYPFEALRHDTACHLLEEDCAQVLPEVWNGQEHEWVRAIQEGIIEPVEGNGQVGKGSWYVPKFTAERDDSLVSFYGLQGEQNRPKLASVFRKPTSWIEYCLEVSPNNCSTPDATALHFPTVEQRGDYFFPGSYRGHFRITPESNCTLNPATCKGYIVGPGCTWSTNIDAQLYWNDIQLVPDGPLSPNGGYEYSHLLQIWRAADATKSNVVMWWWKPEGLVEEFYGTDSQFQQVLLPEATDTCSRARVDTEARCSDDIMERRGDPEGACDQEAHALQKVVAQSFADQMDQQTLASQSPSYYFIKAVKITDLEISRMLRRWIHLDVDRYGNDARETVCGWVVDNIDRLLEFIPPGYPKQLARKSTYRTSFLYTALALAILCALGVVVMALLAYYWRYTKVFIYAQAHIIYLILLGFFLITTGAMVMALEPSSGVCTARVWMVTLGYTIELVPLLVKIAAINTVLSAASKLKRVKISKTNMFRQMGIIIACVTVFLTVWTLVDPPREYEQRVLPDPQGIIVETSLICSSSRGVWTLVPLAWQGLLLFMATVLAFQSRNVAQDFNESQRLGTMIYSHMIFLVLRGIVYFLGGRETFRPNAVAGILSILLSLDTLFAMIIYFVPKCLQARLGQDDHSSSRGGLARTSAAVTAIEHKAAIAYNSYVSNASMIDPAGRLFHRGSTTDPSRRSESVSTSLRSDETAATIGFNHTDGASIMANPLATCLQESIGRTTGGSMFRNRVANHLGELPEVSKEETSDNDMSMPLSGIPEVSEEEQLQLQRSQSRNKNFSSRRESTGSNRSNRRSSLESRGSSRRFSTETPSERSIHLENECGNLSAPSELSFSLPEESALSHHSSNGRLAHSHDDDGDSSSDSIDTGGPRFNSAKANEELERSIQMMSSLDFGLEEEELEEIRWNAHPAVAPFASTGRVNSLDILPETDEDSESNAYTVRDMEEQQVDWTKQ